VYLPGTPSNLKFLKVMTCAIVLVIMLVYFVVMLNYKKAAEKVEMLLKIQSNPNAKVVTQSTASHILQSSTPV